MRFQHDNIRNRFYKPFSKQTILVSKGHYRYVVKTSAKLLDV